MNIIVTGVSRGIGRAVIERFTDLGHKCLGVSRGDESIVSPISYGYNIVYTDWKSMDVLCNNIKSHFRGDQIDIVINNAASITVMSLDELSEQDFLDQFRINAILPFMFTKSLLKDSQLRLKAHIVNVGSMAGFQGSGKFPGLGAYSASKSALVCLTESMAAEWSNRVNVNCLCLGAVNTEMLKQAFPNYVSEINGVEMAQYICGFAVNAHGLVNGQVIPVKKDDPN